MLKEYIFLTLILLGTYSITLHAQNNLPNDCVNAILVCGNGAISSNAEGPGDFQELNDQNSCGFREISSVWLETRIEKSGTLGFKITPQSTDLSVDYDFYVFGPNITCGNLGNTIRCNTTNPLESQLGYNHTGMTDTTDVLYSGPGADGNGYVRSLDVKAGEVYYIVINRPHGGGGFDLEWNGTAMQDGNAFPEGVTANTPNPIIACAINNKAIFDLFSTINEIRTTTEDTVTFYSSLANANDQTNSLSQYFETSSSTTVFARVSNPQVECYEIVELDLEVNYGPDVKENVTLITCDIGNNGEELFELNAVSSEILNTLNKNDYQVSFHQDSISAINNTNLLAENYTANPMEIYARVTELNDLGCFSISNISLELIPTPIVNDYKLIQCDVDPSNSTDGITRTNLTEAEAFLANIDSTYTYTYFRNQKDFDNNDQIQNPERFLNNLAFQQNLIVRIENEDTGCFSTANLFLEILETTASLPEFGPYYSCDKSEINEEIFGEFDLAKIAEDYQNLEVNFYETLENATLEVDALPENYSTGTTTIYARLENLNECQGIEKVELIVRENPDIQLKDTYSLCLNEGTLQIQATNFSSYEWLKKDSSAAFITIGSGKSINITETGVYKLIATNTANGLSCFSEKEFNVEVSNIAKISKDPDVSDISDINIVTLFASGEGDYEYAMETPDDFQDSNTFENVPPGFVTFFVRDKNGCGILETEVAIIGYDKFFTPNNDGINDYWKIKGINSQIQAKSDIQIYDRYGVIVARIRPEDAGWDGTFRGKTFPEDDYWFKVELENGKIFKGHFSLLR
ncbi:T9SS type B sorting domain-containing protein [Zunongwangia endophytica]|uniref:T9SS type B sorting domain-containing protein n=1 Tax=Zunongwangia endophytica TaxID=1808945 RepID=A0ABV8HBR4_9FLAO|nr:T9SS type B sorting domain-containing protein [Zunongwangia endophytica]MDN3593363.1 T9SS type B sorting domain-containing protein [Zunongwangia endophytica]